MLVGQIAGFPSVWNCKHSGEGSLGHSRNVLNWGFLEEHFGCLHSCFGTAVLTESPVITNSSCSENYKGGERRGTDAGHSSAHCELAIGDMCCTQ